MPSPRPHSTRVAGHFGELLQGRLGVDGPVVLVTLPCPALGVTAVRMADRGLRLHTPQRLVSRAQAQRFLGHLGAEARGRLRLRAEMPPGGGAGASTATLVALARLFAPDMSAPRIAEAAVATEGASDPLMFAAPERMLWASREARLVAPMPPLPVFDVIGGFHGPPRATCPQDAHFADISDLVLRWRRAATRSDLIALAQLSSAAARRTLSLQDNHDDPIPDLARDLGALGFVIAHTGSARGLIFAPGQIPSGAKAALRAAGLTQVIQFRAGSHQFPTPYLRRPSRPS